MAPHFGFLAAAISLATPAVFATDASATAMAPSRIARNFEGIDVQYSPGDEDLARLLAHRFSERNAEVARAAAGNAFAPSTAPLSVADLRQRRGLYLQHIAALLGLQQPTSLQVECYDAFVDQYDALMIEYAQMRQACQMMLHVDHVAVWQRAELVRRLQSGEPLAGFRWDAKTHQGEAAWGIHLDVAGGRLKELHDRRQQLHRQYVLGITSHGGATTYRGQVSPNRGPTEQPPTQPSAAGAGISPNEWFPVVVPAVLSGRPAAEQVAELCGAKGPIAQINGSVTATLEKIPLVDPTLAMLVLHETTETGIIDRYMHGPDRRWFCDGVANYVAWRVIRDLDGADLARRAYDLPAQLAKDERLRDAADLRRWPATENQDEQEQHSKLNDARYAFATNAVTLMNARAGEDILPRLFAEIGRTDPAQVTMLTVAHAWTSLTNTPLSPILVEAVYGNHPPAGTVLTDDSQLDLLSPKPAAPKSMALGFDYRMIANRSTGRVSKVTVLRVAKDSVGDKAGLREGDRIVAVDGKILEGMKAGEVKEIFSFKVGPAGANMHRLAIEHGLLHRSSEVILTLESGS